MAAEKSRPDRIISNLIKLSGLGLVVHDYFTAPAGISPETLAGAAFIMSVAQGVESFFETKERRRQR